uniref:Uncharacterized protein n=1 Tax=Tanacetum cinerariifolium TaxID=118510 RepID=A0A6L2JE49_TANCI|nr:hypothetical protein [Tanacetum cinerariifolium]
MVKGAYFGAKTKTFEDILFLTNTPYPGKEIRRISTKSSLENAYSQFPIRRIHLLPYAVSMKITIQRYEDIYILGMYIVFIVNFARTLRDTPQYVIILTKAGNPVKKILLKLNMITGNIKMEVKVPGSSCLTNS